MGKYYKVLLPIFYIGIIGVMVACILLVITGIKNYVEDSNKTKFTLDSVFEDIVEPVNKTESNTIIKPFTSDKVKVGRTFYDYKSEAKKQEKIYYLLLVFHLEIFYILPLPLCSLYYYKQMLNSHYV